MDGSSDSLNLDDFGITPVHRSDGLQPTDRFNDPRDDVRHDRLTFGNLASAAMLNDSYDDMEDMFNQKPRGVNMPDSVDYHEDSDNALDQAIVDDDDSQDKGSEGSQFVDEIIRIHDVDHVQVDGRHDVDDIYAKSINEEMLDRSDNDDIDGVCERQIEVEEEGLEEELEVQEEVNSKEFIGDIKVRSKNQKTAKNTKDIKSIEVSKATQIKMPNSSQTLNRRLSSDVRGNFAKLTGFVMNNSSIDIMSSPEAYSARNSSKALASSSITLPPKHPHSQLNTPKYLKNEQYHDIDSNDSNDEDFEDSGVSMKSIKFLFRLDNFMIKSTMARELSAMLALITVSQASSNTGLIAKVRTLSKMKFMKRFVDNVRYYPRKAFVKWKLLADDKLRSRLIAKIAICSRINHMVAIYRFRQPVALAAIDRRKRMHRYRQAFEKIAVIDDDIDRQVNDGHMNLLRGFSRMKDRHHRSVKIESMIKLIDSMIAKRQPVRAAASKIKQIASARAEVIRRLLKASHCKLHKSFSKLCRITVRVDKSDEGDVIEDIMRSTLYITNKIKSTILSVFEQASGKLSTLDKLSSMGDRQSKRQLMQSLSSLKRNAIDSIKTDSYANVMAMMIQRMYMDRCVKGLLAIRKKAASNRSKKMKVVLNYLYDSQDDKVRYAIQHMINNVETRVRVIESYETEIIRLGSQLRNMIRCRLRVIFQKLKYSNCHTKIILHSAKVFRWIMCNKQAKLERVFASNIERIKAFLVMQDKLREMSKHHLRYSMLRIKNEALALAFFGQINKMLKDIDYNTIRPIIAKRLRISFDAIKMRYYRKMVKQLKLEKIIREHIRCEEDSEITVETIGLTTFSSKRSMTVI